MTARQPDITREALLDAATELIRRQGYVATSVDDVCTKAGVSKGAFFHHFKSKEQLAQAALQRWDQFVAGMEAKTIGDAGTPRERVIAYMAGYIRVFANPDMLKSCLAGTTAQETYDTAPVLRDAANRCFVNCQSRFKSLLDAAVKPSRKRIDTAALASLWISAMQGALILCKASGDQSVIKKSLEHVKQYIVSLLPQT